MSSLDTPLGELVQKNRGTGRGGRGGRGGSRGGRGGVSNGDSAGPQRNQKRYSGAQQQAKPYQRAYVPQQYVPQYVQPAPINLGFAPSNPAGGRWTHDLYAAETPAVQQQPAQPVKKIQGDTIHVSNLASDVTDDDVREIFSRIGTVRSCTVNFNSHGVSTGTATVTFARNTDAEKAVDEYDEAEVDGRVMKLKLVGSIVTAPVIVKKTKPVVVQQQVPQPVYVQAPIQFQQQYQQPIAFRQPKPQKQVVSRGASKTATRGGARGGAAAPQRGGAARGGATATRGGRGGAAASKKPATAEDLDAEMDKYHTAAAPPSAAATGQPTSA